MRLARPTPLLLSFLVVLALSLPLSSGCGTSKTATLDSGTPEVDGGAVTRSYPIVDTAQTACYDTVMELAAPAAGAAFYGQDAQVDGLRPSYTLSADSQTVLDNVTGLTWMRGPNTTLAPPTTADKKTVPDAQAWVATVNAMAYGGFSDWRLPTIKELYSLMDFRGMDPSGYSGSDSSGLTPYVDTAYFHFGYGETSAGERIIDSQYVSSTVFVVNPAETGSPKVFGLNLADGRIKGYDLIMPGGAAKTFFVQLVRGNPAYGLNSFRANADGTVSDDATGLMWSRADSGGSAGMLWGDALAWVEAQNAANYLGHSDWRMPNAKELQSLVDYDNAPDFNGLPAIDTAFFDCTGITNENGEADFPYYWTSTTHAGWDRTGAEAVYIPFGRALGYPGTSWVDVHGAGCQRGDPKVPPPYAYADTHTVTVGGTTYTGYSFGPQGDAIRGYNYVRLVRNGATFAPPMDGGVLPPIDAGPRPPRDAGMSAMDGGMMGPRTCTLPADCTGACPPGSMGCTCAMNPMGSSICVPTCNATSDCPAGPMGAPMTCDTAAHICHP